MRTPKADSEDRSLARSGVLIPIGPSYLRGHLILSGLVAVAVVVLTAMVEDLSTAAVWAGVLGPLCIDPFIWRMVSKSLTVTPERFLGQWGRAIGLEFLLLVAWVLVGHFALGFERDAFLLSLVAAFLACTAYRVHRLLGLKGLVDLVDRPQASTLETA